MIQQEGESEKEQHEPNSEQNQQELEISCDLENKPSNETIIHDFFKKKNHNSSSTAKEEEEVCPTLYSWQSFKEDQ